MCVVLFPYTWGGLVWDDHVLLTDGLWKEDSIVSIWLQSVQGGEIASQYYRPIPMTIFALVQNIAMLHTIALGVHLASTWLMSEWLRSRFEQRGVVYLGALLFAFIRFRQKFLDGQVVYLISLRCTLACGLSYAL